MIEEGNNKFEETHRFQSENIEVYSDEMKEVLSKEKALDLTKFCNLLIKRYSKDISFLTPKQQFSFLRDRALYILPEDNLQEKLKDSQKERKPLTVKFGIDPTGAQVHMGHAVPMVTLNRLQRMGHNIVFVIGDFTAKIGDPTGRSSERPPLTEEQIQKNLSTYKEQVSPFFDMSKSKVVYNGEWLRNLTLNELLKTLSSINVSRVLQREDFRKRLDNQQGLAMSEMLYPIVMGMDSVELKKKEGCDIELGGKDQFLNMQMCRTLMELHGQEPEAIVSTDILEGISGGGLKMSKSLNNYIALNDSPENIFGKLMSIPDHLLELYYKSLTEISNIEREKIQTAITSKNISPMHIKKGLAKILITIIYNKDSAEQAEKQFNDKFSQKNYWELDLPLHTVDKHINLLDYITEKLKKSKSEIRRLADGGGITIISMNNTKIKVNKDNLTYSIGSFVSDENETIIKIGKKDRLKVRTM